MHDITATPAISFQKRAVISISAALAAFLAYSCVYAYRKPFTIAEFEGLKFWGITYQTLLIISQVIGYMLSKFYGIKFIAELNRFGRLRTAVSLVGIAWLCLLFFAIVPAPYGVIFLFINGFVLGFLWGIIFSYLEGRKATDFMGAVMAVSFIFAGGFTRSVAKWLMLQFNINEWWMPFTTGLVFAVPLIFFLWVLEKIPAPTNDDVAEKVVRRPMNKQDRRLLLKKFGVGLIVITVSYLFLTIMRDIRDNYMSNIWKELGYGSDYSVFAKTETLTSLVVLAIMGLLVLVRKNIIALSLVHIVIASGLLLAGLSSLLFIANIMDGAVWMQLVSLGLYMGYIPFNCIFFERMIAAFRIAGNVGFLMYFADSFGYLGSVAVMLFREFSDLRLNWSQFYSYGVMFCILPALAATIYSYIYFNKKYRLPVS